MSKKCKSKYLGLAVASVGIGIIITVMIPLWGWIIAVGGGLVYLGWYISEHRN